MSTEDVKTETEKNQDVADESKVESDELDGVVIENDESEPGELDDENTFQEPDDKEGDDNPPEGDDDGDPSTDTADEGGYKSSDKDLDNIDKADKKDYAFKKKANQLNEKRQEAERLRKERDELKAKLDAQNKTTRPEIPEMPDIYDEDYDKKVAERDQAIKDQIAYDNNVDQQQRIQQERQQNAILAQQQELKKDQDSFRKNAEGYGLDLQELDKTEAYLSKFITPQNAPTVRYMLTRQDGPLLFELLSQEPRELDKVANMNPVEASAYIVESLAPKAALLKPEKSKTPKPVRTLENKKPVKKQDPALDGVIIE